MCVPAYGLVPALTCCDCQTKTAEWSVYGNYSFFNLNSKIANSRDLSKRMDHMLQIVQEPSHIPMEHG